MHLKNLEMRDKGVAVSALKPYCHRNKRQMYDSQCTQALWVNQNVYHSTCVSPIFALLAAAIFA